MTLFDAGLPANANAVKKRRPSLDRRYRDWLAGHGETFDLFVWFASELRAAGHERIGAKAIAERIRWEGWTRVGADGSADDMDAYKVPNQYVSRMVRTLIEADSSWATYFETRRLHS
jgi:hypothetical protein